MTQPKPDPKTPTRPLDLPEDPKVDVQRTWRKFGWKPLAERRHDKKPSQ